MIGKMLGHYQISSQLGKGGMGDVYQAKDQVLGRDVAIKVLPDEFARDGDRVARFQREAKLLASLNHPNIATIHGLEESGGKQFLVMELVEGETLADRIKRGPIPVEESLKLALQIAEALEAAHEKGVIHRDLKPANIKVTPDGKVKVLDFGLAKAFAAEQENLNLSNSPTLSNAATQQGVILGTAAYMSPEQARGKALDKRTDIWAFGCVLYEMLTGQIAFKGEDVSEILASVIKGDVKLDLLPANLHPRVREAITRCLQKDLKQRYPGITDARYEIERALANPDGVSVQPQCAGEGRSKRWMRTLWIAAAILGTAILAAVAGWMLKPAEPREVTRFLYELPKDHQFGNPTDRALAISPDGRTLVYATSAGLCLLRMNQLDARLLPETEGAQNPFFSPDSQWIGYLSSTENRLQKISINGGAPIPLADAAPAGFMTWLADGKIVFANVGKGIMRVSSDGGVPEEIIRARNQMLISPEFLPKGQSVLLSFIEGTSTKVLLRSLKSGESKQLIIGDHAHYLPTGHMVYGLGYDLFAVPFNLDKLDVDGTPFRVAQDILRFEGAPQYAVSDSGTLAYFQGGSAASQRTLVWVDRGGKIEPLDAAPNDYFNPRISPDGTQVALSIGPVPRGEIWIWSLGRKFLKRLTNDPADDFAPLWTPDGKRIAYASNRGIDSGIYWKAVDGTGKSERLYSEPTLRLHPWSWAGKGKTLILQENTPVAGSGMGIAAVSTGNGSEYKPLLRERYAQCQPRVSPDGRWLAYTSNESGKYEVYVRSFPEVNEGKHQISESGGDSPLWSPDGRELFYRNGDAVIAVRISTDRIFSAGAPKILFRGAYLFSGTTGPSWDISPDGKRFLMLKEAGSVAGDHPRKISIVMNWFEELKQRVPTK